MNTVNALISKNTVESLLFLLEAMYENDRISVTNKSAAKESLITLSNTYGLMLVSRKYTHDPEMREFNTVRNAFEDALRKCIKGAIESGALKPVKNLYNIKLEDIRAA